MPSIVTVTWAKAGSYLSSTARIVSIAATSLHFAAGQDITRAVGGAARLHTGQAIGVIGGATRPGSGAAGTGITLVAGKGDVQVQAQSDTLQLQAQGLVDVQSAQSHVDWASVKRITLQTQAGAKIVIDSSGIATSCPGTITVHAAEIDFPGAAMETYTYPLMPKLNIKLKTKRELPISK